MKFNKILSAALVLVMVITSMFVLVPVNASAAYLPDVNGELNAPASVEEYVKSIYGKADESSEYKRYEFSSAEEMLAYELSQKYLLRIGSGKYSLYVNAYTGVVYYVNNVTGQILTSNPWYYSPTSTSDAYGSILSQIELEYAAKSALNIGITLHSSIEAAARGQVTAEYIKNGIRVNYTLGDTSVRDFLPAALIAEKFEELLYLPILGQLREELTKLSARADNPSDVTFDYESDYYKDILYDEHGNLFGISSYISTAKSYINTCKIDGKKLSISDKSLYTKLNNLCLDAQQINYAYTLYTPDMDDNPNPEYSVYKLSGVTNTSRYVEIFKKYCGSYTLAQMIEDESEAGVTVDNAVKPVFRCALEYTLNEDGSISVHFPANSLSFDETVYTIKSLNVLPYFGAAEFSPQNDAYIFYPDGSGAIIKINETPNAQDSNPVYGKDYAYQKISENRYAQITMPVFGLVTETAANPTTALKYGVSEVTNGYFAIIEEGEALSEIVYNNTKTANNLARVYSSYRPCISDQLPVANDVDSEATYPIYSNTKYTGSYVTRYMMLDDEAISKAENVENGNVASYMGMVNYYRNYLYHTTKTLTALETVTENLPLYIEVLGSMEIIKKVLSFPITTSVPLTSFDDIKKIYEDLSTAADVYKAEAESYDQKAAAATDENERLQYEAAAADCRALAVNIKNINFRLTGFANGGLASTYPVKLKWSRACGGKRGFKRLVASAAELSGDADANFGIYPEFDFMYINNTEIFDGISNKGNVSKMLDSRYASKQEYDFLMQQFDKILSSVINPEALGKLYSKFAKKYSKYDATGISISTMGSDLNSNFDKDNQINRYEAQNYVSEVLNNISTNGKYDIMLDTGNAYSLKYASHILNANIDSSHLTEFAYPIPFVGMVLHGSVNYAGTPINYSGTPDYDILRAIESGASLYYILAYNSKNIGHMKDDETLNKYYGVNYSTWREDILATYKELNDAIGNLQDKKIIGHSIIKAERVIQAAEWYDNYKLLIAEFIEKLGEYTDAKVDEAYKELEAAGGGYGTPIKVVFDKQALLAWFAAEINAEYDSQSGKVSFTEAESSEISEELWQELEGKLDELKASFESEYSGGANEKLVEINGEIVYDSAYNFVTDSEADAEDYKATNYTSDIDNIVLVEYEGGVRFILNYNIYSVNVIIDGQTYTVGKYDYQKLEGGSAQ